MLVGLIVSFIMLSLIVFDKGYLGEKNSFFKNCVSRININMYKNNISFIFFFL